MYDLATIVDALGTINVRLGSKQIVPYVSFTSKNKALLDLIISQWPKFGKVRRFGYKRYTIQLFGILPMKSLLEDIIQDMMLQKHAAESVLKFCESRIRNNRLPYTLYEWQLVRQIVVAASSATVVPKRLITIKEISLRK